MKHSVFRVILLTATIAVFPGVLSRPGFSQPSGGDHSGRRSHRELNFIAQNCRCPETVDNGRNPVDPFIPYIISPRSTLLLDPRPLLQWNEIPGATYTVSIRGPQGVIWQTPEPIAATEILYPGNPPLEAGVTYQAIVQADDGTSSLDEDVPGSNFTLLSADDARKVRSALALLAGQNLNPTAEDLLQVYFYLGYYLRAEAIATLKSLIAQGETTALVYRLLGDQYLQVGLSPLAEPPYLEARDIASANQELEELAAALAGLGEVYINLNQREKAIEALTRARDTYETLENASRVRDIDAKLERLR